MLERQLISVGIVTYNSEKYIEGALESVYNQTYQNIELIISDDGSVDTTVQICREWLKSHSTRFERVKILDAKKNSGTSGNMNRLFEECKGKWVKPFAGDDRLLPNAIENFVSFCQKKPNYDIVFSKVMCVDDCGKKHHWIYSNPLWFFKKMTYKEMYYALLDKNFLPAPSVFILKKCWAELGKYNEEIPLLEDWPFWLKAFKNKKNIGCMDAFTAIYRFSDTSVSQGNAEKKVKDKFSESFCRAEKNAKDTMKNDGLGGYINYLVRYFSSRDFCFWHIIRLVNFLNPYRYFFNKAISKRNLIIENINNE